MDDRRHQEAHDLVSEHLGEDHPAALRFATAAAFAAAEEESTDPLALDAERGAVIPAGGFVLVYGNGGAGKTTLVLDLVAHLATGHEWLGLVTPARPLRIALIENEGPRPMFRKKVAAKLAVWPDAGEQIVVLEEPWSGMTFGVTALRDQLVEYLSAEEVDLLVAAPLARLGMQGGGTLDDIGAFMRLVSDVKRRAAPLSVLLVHHENRAGRVSGAWEGDPDTLLHVQAQGHGRTRLYVEKSRWSSALHGRTVHLRWAEGESFEVEEREEVTEATMADAIRAAVREFPGGSWRTIRDHVRGNVTEAAAIRNRLISDGEIVNGAAQEGRFALWAADDPAAPGSDLRTAVEPLWSPFPEEGPGGGPVPGSSVREPGTGTAPWNRVPSNTKNRDRDGAEDDAEASQ